MLTTLGQARADYAQAHPLDRRPSQFRPEAQAAQRAWCQRADAWAERRAAYQEQGIPGIAEGLHEAFEVTLNQPTQLGAVAIVQCPTYTVTHLEGTSAQETVRDGEKIAVRLIGRDGLPAEFYSFFEVMIDNGEPFAIPLGASVTAHRENRRYYYGLYVGQRVLCGDRYYTVEPRPNGNLAFEVAH